MADTPFIVLDGPDGGGKSTQARRLVSLFRKEGRDVTHLREPGSTRLSEVIRKWLLDPKVEMAMMTEALLYTAARTPLVAEQILPALEAGTVVICERFYWSTIVYQGIAGSLGKNEMSSLQKLAIGNCRPALTIILDLPAEIGLQRVPGRHDRIESRALAYHRKVRAGFRKLASENKRKSILVDTRNDADWVWTRIEREVRRRFL
jgi:dTMP kinase